MSSSSILRLFGYCPRTRIYPEYMFSVKQYHSTDTDSCSSSQEQEKGDEIRYPDPCTKIYERLREPGAYEQYRRMLSSST
jgi:hypothetical protein